MTQPVDLIVHGRWLLPVEPSGAVLADHGIAVQDGRIVAVAPRGVLRQQFAARTEVDCSSHVLLPGFIDAHTAAARSLLRVPPPQGPLQRWQRETLAPVEDRWVSAEFVRVGTRLAIAQMLRAGITGFADRYLFPEEVARLAAELRLRTAIGLPVAERRTAWADGADEHLARGAALWDAHRADPWARLYFAPSAGSSLSDATLAHLRRIADQLDAPLAMSLHETAADVRESLAAHGRRPMARLAQLGLLRPGFTALDMVHADEGDLEIARRAGVGIVHCPQADLRQGHGLAPLRSLLATRLPVGLGSGGATGCGIPDLLAEARLAALLAAGREAQPGVVDAHAAIALATLGGARVLGFDADCGSLRPGKAADFIAVDLAHSPALDAAAVADALLQDATRADITDVWVGGRRAVRSGRLELIDSEEIESLAGQWMVRMGLGAAA